MLFGTCYVMSILSLCSFLNRLNNIHSSYTCNQGGPILSTPNQRRRCINWKSDKVRNIRCKILRSYWHWGCEAEQRPSQACASNADRFVRSLFGAKQHHRLSCVHRNGSNRSVLWKLISDESRYRLAQPRQLHMKASMALYRCSPPLLYWSKPGLVRSCMWLFSIQRCRTKRAVLVYCGNKEIGQCIYPV